MRFFMNNHLWPFPIFRSDSTRGDLSDLFGAFVASGFVVSHYGEQFITIKGVLGTLRFMHMYPSTYAYRGVYTPPLGITMEWENAHPSRLMCLRMRMEVRKQLHEMREEVKEIQCRKKAA